MKVIVRDMETGLYANGYGTWGDTQSEAIEFDNAIAALNLCDAQNLRNVEILLLTGEPRPQRPLFVRPTPVLGIPALVRAPESPRVHVPC
jgi:hypothetical protein